MEQRNFGRTGLQVSELCLGCMTFGSTLEEKDSIRIIHQALDNGITILDTANAYSEGRSENIVGNALQEKRKDVFLATKVRHPEAEVGNFVKMGLSRRHILDCIEMSLRRLKTDYIDLYQIHGPDPKTPLEHTMRALDQIIEQGKARYIGCSNLMAWQIAKANGVADLHHWTRFDSIQPCYHLLIRRAETELFPYCQEEQMAIISYSPLGGGLLTGKYKVNVKPSADTRGGKNPEWYDRMMTKQAFKIVDTLTEIGKKHNKTTSQVAISWVLSHPVITSTIIGVNSLDDLKDNLGASGFKLSAEELKQIEDIEYKPKP